MCSCTTSKISAADPTPISARWALRWKLRRSRISSSSFSTGPIPYVYGLTCGELATLLNEEGMLRNGVKCKLTVVPMEGWEREMRFSDTGLQWVPTSPHIPSEDTPQYYVSTGIMGELGVISEGVGYTIPFRT